MKPIVQLSLYEIHNWPKYRLELFADEQQWSTAFWTMTDDPKEVLDELRYAIAKLRAVYDRNRSKR